MRKFPPYILTDPNSGRHLYKRGWLGLIPLVGGFVGIGLMMYSIVRYKDKKLFLIGLADLLFTVLLYGSLFYYGEYSDAGGKEFAELSVMNLNNLVKNIKFYNVQHGEYPDSLESLTVYNKAVFINDPLLLRGSRPKDTKFIYHKLDNKYTVFSAGIDKLPSTADDIYPTVDLSDTTNFGFIKR